MSSAGFEAGIPFCSDGSSALGFALLAQVDDKMLASDRLRGPIHATLMSPGRLLLGDCSPSANHDRVDRCATGTHDLTARRCKGTSTVRLGRTLPRGRRAAEFSQSDSPVAHERAMGRLGPLRRLWDRAPDLARLACPFPRDRHRIVRGRSNTAQPGLADRLHRGRDQPGRHLAHHPVVDQAAKLALATPVSGTTAARAPGASGDFVPGPHQAGPNCRRCLLRQAQSQRRVRLMVRHCGLLCQYQSACWPCHASQSSRNHE